MNENTIYSIILIITAYLIGAIPTAVWVGRIFFKTDIRKHGSGNAGATNSFRILGKKAGIPVLIFDAFKGFAAVNLVYLFRIYEIGIPEYINLEIYLAFSALFGHIFPIYVGFKGGKGMASLIGIGLALAPYATLICMGVFLLVFLLSGFVSLASMSSGLAFTLLTTFFFPQYDLPYIIFGITITILLVITHYDNIIRLKKKEEYKFAFRKKKESEI
ncbi:MAG: glycerol-3-phosphate 1-O-acyltransferase PlsY [Bacteroidota bacterium]